MKLYNITGGQLVTIWVFGILITFTCLVNLGSYDPQIWSQVGVFLIPGLLVFYTLGWKNYKKLTQGVSEVIPSKVKTVAKKFLLKAIGLVAVLIVITIILTYFPQSEDANTQDSDTVVSSFVPKGPDIQSYWWSAQATSTSDGSLTLSKVDAVILGTSVSDDFGYNSYGNTLETSGRFVKAVFTVTNNTSSSIMFKIDQLALIDNAERKFEAIKMFNCNNPLKEYAGPYDGASYNSFQLKPAIPCRVSVLYEIPNESTAYTIGIALRTGLDVYAR
jgi:hypothetical protein